MEAYQQRVVDEKTQLDDRLQKLAAFLMTPVFAKLDAEEKIRLQRQCTAMRSYSVVLAERIACFKEVA